jgi:hypothetical protein
MTEDDLYTALSKTNLSWAEQMAIYAAVIFAQDHREEFDKIFGNLAGRSLPVLKDPQN